MRMTDRPIEASQITTLLLGLEQRGKEASGVVLVDKDSSEFFILKDGVAASQFTEQKAYKEFLEEHLSSKTRTALVHARFHTLGSPRVNSNNHPVFAENCAVVHNGAVSNHREMFEKMSLDRKAEVDTDIIRAICDREGLTHKTVRELSRLSGSIAAAVIDRRKPNCLLLLRSGNPLCLGVSEDHIIFASLQKTVAAASKTWIKRFGVWAQRAAKDIHYSIFPSDSAWFFGPSEREWHQKFSTAAYTYSPGNHRGAWWNEVDDFESADSSGVVIDTRTSTSEPFKYDKEKWTAYLRCPNSKCNRRCFLTDEQMDIEPGELICVNCKQNLKLAQKIYTLRSNYTS